jgi:hypothetical protein
MLPVIGWADDVILVLLVLRSRRAPCGAAALDGTGRQPDRGSRGVRWLDGRMTGA